MPRQQNEVDQPPQQSIEAERALLGAILLDGSKLALIAEKIEPSFFFHDHHRKIYLAMLQMDEDGQAIDLVTLSECLQTKKELEAVGGVAYISQLLDGVPHITNIGHYAQIVKEKAVRRRLLYAAREIQNQALAGEENLEKMLANAEQSLCKVMASQSGDIVPRLNGNGNGHITFKDYSLADFMAASFPAKEHLIEATTPRNGRAMLIALPHRLKSWFTTGLALASTKPGVAFGHLKIEKPVRTYLAQLEDWPGELQSRIASLIVTEQFRGCVVDNLKILPRCSLDLTDNTHFAWFLGRLKEFQPDHVVLDVLRKFFSGDVNSPKETAAFLKRLDFLQDAIGCALTLVHHENRKKEELMLAAAGSYNWAGWAEVMIHFSRKTEAKTENGPITAVEIDVDTKAGPPVETMRLVLDTSQQNPLRMEALEDGTGFHESMKQLAPEGWTVDNLATVLEVHRKSAWKRIVSWEKSGKIEKIKSGKRGRGGGLALWRSLDPIDTL